MLSGFMINDGGSGYTAAPNVGVEVPGGSGDSYGIATATVGSGEVTSVDLADGEVMYTMSDLGNIDFNGVPVTVSIFKDGGSLAAELSTGSVVAVNVNNGGSGYTQAPPVRLVSAAGDPGSGATAEAVVQDGRVIAVNIIDAGSGYLTAPDVEFIEPDDAPKTAAAIALVNSEGTITGVQLRPSQDAKSGPYYSASYGTPATSGEGYIETPAVTVIPLVAGQGSGAILEAVINTEGEVTAINVVDGGSGYLGGNTTYAGNDTYNTPANTDGGDQVDVSYFTITNQSNDQVISGKSTIRNIVMGTGRVTAN